MYTTLIDFESLCAQLGNTDLLIFDVRYDLMNKDAGREAYLSSHIPGAIYVDLNSDLSRPPSINMGRHPLPNIKSMNELFSELGVSGKKQVVVYDDVFGSFSSRLWWMLKYLQHDKVAVLDGGWQHWINLGGPVSTKNEKRISSQFKGTELEKALVNIDQVSDYDLIVDSGVKKNQCKLAKPPICDHSDLSKNDVIPEGEFNKILLDLEIKGLISVSWQTKNIKRIEYVTIDNTDNEYDKQIQESEDKDYEASFPNSD